MRQHRCGRDVGRALVTSSLAALFLACASGSGEAGSLSYQEGDGKGVVSQTDDTRLEEANPTTNFSTTTSCSIDRNPHQHCTLKFPNVFGSGVDQIPPASAILSATLTVFVTNAGVECPIVYQLTEAGLSRRRPGTPGPPL